ncbi:hypothetical protein CF635_003623 [Enterobacter hormaechei]|nr:hypothetical protein [Enterobacter hormaechei]
MSALLWPASGFVLPAWRGVAWRGVAWRGVAWRGVAWRGADFRSGRPGGLSCYAPSQQAVSARPLRGSGFPSLTQYQHQHHGLL